MVDRGLTQWGSITDSHWLRRHPGPRVPPNPVRIVPDCCRGQFLGQAQEFLQKFITIWIAKHAWSAKIICYLKGL